MIERAPLLAETLGCDYVAGSIACGLKCGT